MRSGVQIQKDVLHEVEWDTLVEEANVGGEAERVVRPEDQIVFHSYRWSPHALARDWPIASAFESACWPVATWIVRPSPSMNRSESIPETSSRAPDPGRPWTGGRLARLDDDRVVHDNDGELLGSVGRAGVAAVDSPSGA